MDSAVVIQIEYMYKLQYTCTYVHQAMILISANGKKVEKCMQIDSWPSRRWLGSIT